MTQAYKRLPGKAKTLLTTSTLWLAEDHILLVKSTRIVEEYRRFYFPDVQAIVIRRTMPFHYGWTLFLFALALLTGWLIFDRRVTMGVLAASALFLWLRGPSCVCELYTAVQRESLPSLHRLKTAQRVLESLRASIEQRQGTVESIPEQPFAVASPPALPGPPPLPEPPPVPAVSIAPAAATFHVALFTVMLATVPLVAAGLFLRLPWISSAVALASVAEFFVLMPLLVWQTGKTLSTELKSSAWAAAGRWILVQFFAWMLLYKAALIDKTSRDVAPASIKLASGWVGWLNLITLVMVGLAEMYFAWEHSRARAYAPRSAEV